MTNPPTRFVSQAEFARQLGVVKSYITQLKQAGRLVMTPGGHVDVEASRAQIIATSDSSRVDVAARWAEQRGASLALNAHPANAPAEATSGPASDDAEPQASDIELRAAGIPSKAVSAAKKEYFAALNAEMEYHKNIGDLVLAAEFGAAIADICIEFRQALEQLPGALAADVLGRDLEATTASIKLGIHAALAGLEKRLTDRIAELGKGAA